MSTIRTKTLEPKKEGISPAAFWIALITAIILAILLIILLILFFRRDANLINADECPEAVSGLLVKPDEQIVTIASNCGLQLDCTYTVSSVKEAVQICESLGTEKCKTFTLKQVPASDDFILTISDITTTSIDIGSDSFRIIL